MIKQRFNKPISKRFIDAFPKFKRDEEDEEDVKFFLEVWNDSPFKDNDLTEDDLKSIYNHLLAAYYNWHYVYLDDLGICLNTMHVIHEYYPNTKKRLALVEELREMDLDDFKRSGINIESNGSNPKIATDMDELIDLVDSQRANFTLKSDEQALRAQFMSLQDGVMDEFIDRFAYMFTKLYTGVNSYVYCNDIEEDEEE